MSTNDDDLERRLRELRATGALDRDPYGRDPRGRDPYGRDPYYPDPYGSDPYNLGGRRPVRPGPPEATVGRALAGVIFGWMLPAAVAGLIAYIVGGPWPAVWWGVGTFIVMVVLSTVVGLRQLR
jgi:hypothetical protein